ncbi:MAG TPA: tetratricopeptide repeat protein [Alphaproteobacteria bacterium]|jgi:TPR repeat protein
MKPVQLAIFTALGLLVAMETSAAQNAAKPAALSATKANDKLSPLQLIASADAGNAEAEYAAAALILLGGMPSTAHPALLDPAKADALAVKYLVDASTKGNAPAQYLLGTLYLSGRGVTMDALRAKSLFTTAADAGNTDAQNALGQMLRKGLAGARDDKGAAAWFEKASSQGNMLALTNLGYMYSNGLGVPKDEKKALDMTVRAAAAEVEEAQHNLGWMYQQGKGVAQSTPDAVSWYRRAAEQGYSPSALNVGFIYAKGEAGGDIRDQMVEAVKWFALAGTSSDDAIRDTAKKAIAYVAERVPPEVMLDGSEAAQKWMLKRQMGGVTTSANTK